MPSSKPLSKSFAKLIITSKRDNWGRKRKSLSSQSWQRADHSLSASRTFSSLNEGFRREQTAAFYCICKYLFFQIWQMYEINNHRSVATINIDKHFYRSHLTTKLGVKSSTSFFSHHPLKQLSGDFLCLWWAWATQLLINCSASRMASC